MKLAVNQYELGMVFLLTDRLSLGHEHLEKALANAEQSGDPMVLGCVYRAAGQLKAALQEKADAACSFLQALKHFKRAGDLLACKEVEDLMKKLEPA
jgi:hypothetical protein